MTCFSVTKIIFLHGITSIFSTVESQSVKPYELAIPPNNHGVQPQVLIKEDTKVSLNNLLTIIPILSTEWSISLNIRVVEHPTNWTNIIRVTANIPNDEYGDFVPLIQIKPATKAFYYRSAVNSSNHYYFEGSPYDLNQTHHVEIHQRFVSNGNYRFFILLDSVEIHTVVNTDARQFYNVHVYATDDLFNEAPNAYISDFEHVNFM